MIFIIEKSLLSFPGMFLFWKKSPQFLRAIFSIEESPKFLKAPEKDFFLLKSLSVDDFLLKNAHLVP